MPLIAASSLPTGNLNDADHGATISLILDRSEPGHGPRSHEHPYDETWVVIEGHLTFEAGEERLEAGPGDIVIVPPKVPHKFTNHGPGPANLGASTPALPSSPSGWNEWPTAGCRLLL